VPADEVQPLTFERWFRYLSSPGDWSRLLSDHSIALYLRGLS
jgi:hypothetical protein